MSSISIVGIAINRIHRKGKTPDVVNAKSAFRFDSDEFGRLKKLNAVRAATADEVAAYEAEQARINGADVLAAQAAAASSGETVTTERKPARTVGKKKEKAAETETPAAENETAGAGADGDGDADQSGKNAADDEI